MPTDNSGDMSGNACKQEQSGEDFERFTLAFYRFEFPLLASYLDAAKAERKQGVSGSRGKAKDFICRAAESELTKAEGIESRETVLLRIEAQIAEVKALLEKGGIFTGAGVGASTSQEFYPENKKLSSALSALGY